MSNNSEAVKKLRSATPGMMGAIRDADFFAKSVKIGDVYLVAGNRHRVTEKTYYQLSDGSCVVQIEHKYEKSVNDDGAQVFEEEVFGISELDVYMVIDVGERMRLLEDNGRTFKLSYREIQKVGADYDIMLYGRFGA